VSMEGWNTSFFCTYKSVKLYAIISIQIYRVSNFYSYSCSSNA
jgi:hypothetical protein